MKFMRKKGTMDMLARDRTRLANERTFLAHTRTMLSFVIVGLALIEFFDENLILVYLGGLSIVIGLVVFGFGLVQYKKFKSKINGGISF